MAHSLLLFTVHSTFIIYTDQVMGLEGKHGFMWNWFIKFSIWFSVGLLLYVFLIIISSWAVLTYMGIIIKKANYYIAFIILSEALEDPSFNLPWIHILNSVLNYFYVGLLVMCFLLSLGNRPQGSKWGYTLAMIGFALITIYMTVCLSYYYYFRICFTTFSTHFLKKIGFGVFTCY